MKSGQIEALITKHLQLEKPVLLGLSGGPDSMALFHILLDMQKRIPLQLGLAHIDHGWRAESAAEAQNLAQMAQKLSLPFHLQKLDPSQIKGNLEAACREERLNFFKKLCIDYGYQAVILGHHKDDNTETVLKKILEGAALPSLTGMSSAANIEGLNIWRPLLNTPKAEILEWLQEKGITFFSDKTNEDPAFLRARFRKVIIPLISDNFGKDITDPLNRIAREAEELNDHLNLRLKSHLESVLRGKMGSYIDLTSGFPESKFELKHLIKRFCENHHLFLSHQILENALDLLSSGAADRTLYMHGKTLVFDRKRMFLITRPWAELTESLPLNPGQFKLGEWSIECEWVTEAGENQLGWQKAWDQDLIVHLPQGEYTLGPAKMNATCVWGSHLDKWWTNHKIPAFFRSRVPVIRKDGQIYCELLTSKNYNSDTQCYMRVKMGLE